MTTKAFHKSIAHTGNLQDEVERKLNEAHELRSKLWQDILQTAPPELTGRLQAYHRLFVRLSVTHSWEPGEPPAICYLTELCKEMGKAEFAMQTRREVGGLHAGHYEQSFAKPAQPDTNTNGSHNDSDGQKDPRLLDLNKNWELLSEDDRMQIYFQVLDNSPKLIGSHTRANGKRPAPALPH